MNISITATLRSEILQTAEKLSTGHTTSQPNHSKFSVWIKGEDVNPIKNKGRVNTHISAGSKRWRFSVTLDKGDLHTVLLPQMEQKRSQPYSLGLQLLPQCSCQPTLSSCSSILHSICAWEVPLRQASAGTAAAAGLVASPEPPWQGLYQQHWQETILLQRELELVLRHNLPSTRASGWAPATLEALEH